MRDLEVGIVICSDRAAKGERQDQTAESLRASVRRFGTVTAIRIVADVQGEIEIALRQLATNNDVVLTSGGTGIGSRDVTVEATLAVIDRELPGFGELMRMRSVEKVPTAILSRATAGTLGASLIINLPGSPRGAVECLEWVSGAIPHAVQLLRRAITDCQVRDQEAP